MLGQYWYHLTGGAIPYPDGIDEAVSQITQIKQVGLKQVGLSSIDRRVFPQQEHLRVFAALCQVCIISSTFTSTHIFVQ